MLHSSICNGTHHCCRALSKGVLHCRPEMCRRLCPLPPLAEAAQARPVRQQWQPNTLLPSGAAAQNQPPVHTGLCTGLAVVLHRPRTHRQEAPCCAESAHAPPHCSRSCKPIISRLARESTHDEHCHFA